MAPRDGPSTPKPTWRCPSHEPLVAEVAAIGERTKRTLDILERMERRDDRLSDRQRSNAATGQLLSGAWSGTLKTATLIVAASVGLGAVVGVVVAVIKLAAG